MLILRDHLRLTRNYCALRVNKLWGGDEINSSFCIGINHECPINDIYVISKNTPISKEYEARELDKNNILIFTKSGNFLPVVQLKLTEGSVCFNSNGYQTSRDRKLYPLSNYGTCDRSYKMKSTDPRYKHMGDIREDRLFGDNEILDVVSALPNYPINETKKYNWNLYSNSYFYWSHHCDESPSTSRGWFFSILEGIIDVKNQNNYILETSVFYAIGVCLIMQYFFWYFTLSVFRHREDISKPMRTLFHLFGYPIKIISLSFLLYFSYYWISTITSYQDAVVTITVSEWAPDFTSQSLFAYEEFLQSVYHITYRVVILSFLSLAWVLFDLCLELSVRGVLQTTYGRLFDEYVQ